MIKNVQGKPVIERKDMEVVLKATGV